MSEHAPEKTHLAAALIFGLVLAVLLTAIFGFLMGNYTKPWPMLVAYGAWAILSLFLFGKGGDDSGQTEHH